MIKRLIVILFIILYAEIHLDAQDKSNINIGKISYITSENIYVKFENTADIKVGDTIYFNNVVSLFPCLIVTRKSSTSCVGRKINDCPLKLEDSMIHRYGIDVSSHVDSIENLPEDPIADDTSPVSPLIPEEESGPPLLYKEKIRGKVTASNNSNFSSLYDNRHRSMLRFSVDARHLDNSKVSFSSYAIYRYEFLSPSENSLRKRRFLRIYDMSIKYDIDYSTRITVGRKINDKISSIGAIDGVQAEKYFNNFYIGTVLGFRPDIKDFGLNMKLPEYGAYVGFSQGNDMLYSQSTLGVLEQRNGSSIDRRFLYLQHSSTISGNFNFFTSFEVDIYKNIADVSGGQFRLTNLYVSARYRLNRIIGLSVSYDSRKQIIYYETLKTDLERLLDDDDARQGLRFRLNYRPLKHVYTGISYGRRFQNNGENKSNNINGFISSSNISKIGGRAHLSYNWNRSNYHTSKVLSIRYGRQIFKRILYGEVYFRNVDYNLSYNETFTTQKYFGTLLSYRVNKQWSLSFLGELSTRKNEKNYRMNTRVSRRF